MFFYRQELLNLPPSKATSSREQNGLVIRRLVNRCDQAQKESKQREVKCFES